MDTRSEYRDYAWETSETPAHQYLLPTLLRVLGDRKDRCILDLGCGSGHLASQLLDRGFNVYGVDPSESGIAIARSRWPERFHLVNPSTWTLPENIRELPFDTVISTEVIEHLYDPVKFVRSCASVLPLGGELIISTPYHGYLKNLALALAGAMDNHFTALWQGGHIKFWSRKTLEALLAGEGFSAEEFRGSGRLPWLWKSMFIRARYAPGALAHLRAEK